MATARPGWSRRAQYGLFFSFLAVIAGIIVGLILLALSLVAPSEFQRVRGAALDVTAPATGAMRAVTATVEGVFTGAGNYWDAASQIAKRLGLLKDEPTMRPTAIAVRSRSRS